MDRPMLETQRLILRPLVAEDADGWWRVVWSDADVTRYLPPRRPIPRERMRNRMQSVVDHWDMHGFGVWALVDRRSDELIGHCGLIVNEPPDVELIYALGRDAWGHGFASEAASRVVEHAFTELNLDRVVALVFPENTASSRVVEKLGAHQDGTVTRFDSDLLRYLIVKSP